jgi:hypothetical protein
MLFSFINGLPHIPKPYQYGTFTYQLWNILWITLLSW